MGRAIFFIVNTVFSCNSVYAVADASENIRTGSSNDDSGIYTDGGSDQNLLAPDPVGEEWRKYFAEITQREDTHEDQADEPPRISLFDFVGGGGSSGGGGASISGLETRVNGIDSRVGALERWRINHDSWAGGLANRVSAIENWISNWALPKFTNYDNYWNSQWSLNAWQDKVNVARGKYWDEQWAKNTSFGSRISTNETNIAVQRKYWTEQWDKNTWQNKVNDARGKYWEEQWAKNTWQNKVNDTRGKYWEEQWAKNTWQDTVNATRGKYWDEQWAKNTWQDTINTTRGKYWEEQWAKNTTQNNRIDTLETWRKNHDIFASGLTLKVNNLKTDITEINKKIDSFSWSDVGIITALVAVKDSIDNFKKMFDVDDLVGLNAHEGIFTRMIKSQFIALRNDLRDLFKEYFGVEGDNANLTPTGIFSKYLGDQIYRLRYSMVAGFGEIEDVLKLISTDTLGIRDSLNTVNLNLNAVNTWLKAIFDKPVGTVIAPAFDFNRLEQILRSLNFGNATNEAGTNLWDFLTSLIDNLGNIIGKGIDGLSSTLGKILDILGGLVDTIIGLIVPENWDFLEKDFGNLKGKFDTKFKFFLDLGGLVQNLFKPTKQDFLKAISFTWLGVNFDFTQSQSSLDIYVPKFRLAISVFIWAITAIYIYRKITGTGDVINDS